jgi:hypothetical protein
MNTASDAARTDFIATTADFAAHHTAHAAAHTGNYHAEREAQCAWFAGDVS